MNILSFKALREGNIARLPLFKNKHGELAHTQPDGSDWSIFDWAQAVMGETGEYANFRKKYDRGDLTPVEFEENAEKELADSMTYLDIFAFRLNFSLEDLFKFDESTAKTFEDLRLVTTEFVEQSGAYYKTYQVSQIFVRMQYHICNVCQAYETNHVPEERNEKMRVNLCMAILLMDVLAWRLNINLGEAVRTKFDEVSRRIGVDIFMP